MSMFTHAIVFRQYRPEDNQEVKHLHEKALRDTNAYEEWDWKKYDKDLDEIENFYMNNDGNFVVGLLDDKIIAMGAYLRLDETTAKLRRMRVEPELQKQGIGRQLLDLLETEIRDRGYISIELNTTINQVAAQKLYEQTGYHVDRRETEGWPIELIYYRKELDI
ncbi:MAG TPA: GNAT family N-acetyltransferase [Acidimicrobiia bacterium]|nr:GNAT family N-acetyltransferase [Acidimicrobiia bacterium]